jgi:hypothetical protein
LLHCISQRMVATDRLTQYPCRLYCIKRLICDWSRNPKPRELKATDWGMPNVAHFLCCRLQLSQVSFTSYCAMVCVHFEYGALWRKWCQVIEILRTNWWSALLVHVRYVLIYLYNMKTALFFILLYFLFCYGWNLWIFPYLTVHNFWRLNTQAKERILINEYKLLCVRK